MIGRVVAVNYKRGLVAYECEDGDYGYFEVLGSDNIERDDEIIGNLKSLGGEMVINKRNNSEISVFIEDFGMSRKGVIQQIS